MMQRSKRMKQDESIKQKTASQFNKRIIIAVFIIENEVMDAVPTHAVHFCTILQFRLSVSSRFIKTRRAIVYTGVLAGETY